MQYDKKPRTCHNCRSLNHTARQCDVLRHIHAKDWSNAVNIDLGNEIPNEKGYSLEGLADSPDKHTESPVENTEYPELNKETHNELPMTLGISLWRS